MGQGGQRKAVKDSRGRWKQEGSGRGQQNWVNGGLRKVVKGGPQKGIKEVQKTLTAVKKHISSSSYCQ
jgi:hypothetical protein